MLTKRIRKQIEWQFKNYQADAALYEDRVRDIVDAGLTANYSGVGVKFLQAVLCFLLLLLIA